MYMYMKKCAEGGPVVPVQQIWLDSMLKKVPAHLQKSVQQQRDIEELFDEVKRDFKSSMKKSMGNGQRHKMQILNISLI